MGQVIDRQPDDAVSEKHRRMARAQGVSLERQLREVLSVAARPSRADALRARTRPGEFPSSAEVVREDRDAR